MLFENLKNKGFSIAFLKKFCKILYCITLKLFIIITILHIFIIYESRRAQKQAYGPCKGKQW